MGRPAGRDGSRRVACEPGEAARLIMTSPQEGNPSLGQAWLRGHKLPHAADGLTSFPIALPNGVAGPRGERHTAVRTCSS